MSTLRLKESLFELPSQGQHDLGVPLIGDSQVRIRPLLKGDQKAISAPGASNYQVLYSLLDRVIVEPRLDLDRMLLADCVAVLFAVRLMSFGAHYPIRYQCDNCEEFVEISVNLLESEVRYAEDRDTFEVRDLEVTLSTGAVVTYHLPTLGDEKAIAAQVKNLAKRGDKSNPKYNEQLARITQLCNHVSSLSGDDQPFVQRMKFFDEELTMADERKIWKAVYDSDLGLVPESEHTCPHCSYDNTVLLNIDQSFFRPSDE